VVAVPEEEELAEAAEFKREWVATEAEEEGERGGG
jgi:hypothetical protein